MPTESSASDCARLKWPYLKPRNMNWSQIQENRSMRTMLGNEKMNQLAKLITSPFPGNILHKKRHRCRGEERKTSKHVYNIFYNILLLVEWCSCHGLTCRFGLWGWGWGSSRWAWPCLRCWQSNTHSDSSPSSWVGTLPPSLVSWTADMTLDSAHVYLQPDTSRGIKSLGGFTL